MVVQIHINHERKEKTTLVIVEAQSVKNTDTAKYQGYDAGKKVSGDLSLKIKTVMTMRFPLELGSGDFTHKERLHRRKNHQSH